MEAAVISQQVICHSGTFCRPTCPIFERIGESMKRRVVAALPLLYVLRKKKQFPTSVNEHSLVGGQRRI